MTTWGFEPFADANGTATQPWNVYQGGQFDAVDDAILDSVTIKVSTPLGQYRTAVFLGGSDTDMASSVLIEDLGVLTADAIEENLVFPSLTNPSLPNAGYLWIGVKTSGNSQYRKTQGVPQADVTALRRYFNTDDNIATTPFATNPPSNGEAVTGSVWAMQLEYSIAVSGPTITAPDTVTQGTLANVTGTGLDTIVAFALQTSSLLFGLVQSTWSSSSAIAGTFTPESGSGLCTPGNPVLGLPMTPTVTGAGVTIDQIQMFGSDGVDSNTKDVSFPPESTHEVLQELISGANTTSGESIWATDIFTGGMQDNAQARVPKEVDGVTLTWAAPGTVVASSDQTVTFPIQLFSRDNGQWGEVILTVKQSSITPTVGGMLKPMIESMIKPMIENIIH